MHTAPHSFDTGTGKPGLRYAVIGMLCAVGLLVWVVWSFTAGFLPLWTSDLKLDWRIYLPIPLGLAGMHCLGKLACRAPRLPPRRRPF